MSAPDTVSVGAQGTDAPLLEVRNLVVRYGKKGPAAVDDVSFAIARGETLGLVGESGSGKTTIGRAILGLQPVSDGQILFEGRDITRASVAERRALQGDLLVAQPAPGDRRRPHGAAPRRRCRPRGAGAPRE